MEPSDKALKAAVDLLAMVLGAFGVVLLMEVSSSGRLQRRVDALARRLAYDEGLMNWGQDQQPATAFPDAVVVDETAQDYPEPEPQDAVPAPEPLVTPLRRSNARKTAVARETTEK